MKYPNIQQLEKNLTDSLRDMAAGNARAMSASLVLVSDYDTADRADTLVNRLMGRRPVRVLHVRGFAPDYSSRASARCALDRASRGVCFEDIYIESPGSEAFEGRVWGSLLIRELPALLLWFLGMDRLEGFIDDCAERVDLVLIDPSDPNIRKNLSVSDCRERIQKTIRHSGPVCDLAWERSLSFRYALSRLFEGEHLADLDKLESVTLSCFDTWSAALVGAWLRSRLATRNRSVVVQINDSESCQEEAAILSFKGDSSQASLLMHGGGRGSLSYRNGTVQNISLPEQNSALILERLSDAPVSDPLYAAVLDYMADIR